MSNWDSTVKPYLDNGDSRMVPSKIFELYGSAPSISGNVRTLTGEEIESAEGLMESEILG